jgi:hypothetical protein
MEEWNLGFVVLCPICENAFSTNVSLAFIGPALSELGTLILTGCFEKRVSLD